jgi:hypothetical protein
MGPNALFGTYQLFENQGSPYGLLRAFCRAERFLCIGVDPVGRTQVRDLVPKTSRLFRRR